MKNIKTFLAYFLTILGINCQAQTPIIDLNDRDGNIINGAYYKDTNNLLNQFEGTYILDDGTNDLKIVLKDYVDIIEFFKTLSILSFTAGVFTVTLKYFQYLLLEICIFLIFP